VIDVYPVDVYPVLKNEVVGEGRVVIVLRVVFATDFYRLSTSFVGFF
jgi:hypothetical protein